MSVECDNDDDVIEDAIDDDGGEVFITSNFSRIFSTLIILLLVVGSGMCSDFSSSSSSCTVSLGSDPTQSEPFRARNDAKESLSLCLAALNRTPIFLSSPHN